MKMLCTVAVVHCKNISCVYVSLEVIVPSSSVRSRKVDLVTYQCVVVLLKVRKQCVEKCFTHRERSVVTSDQ